MNKLLITALFCFVSAGAWAATTTLPTPIPNKVDVKITASMKNNAMIYNAKDDDILMFVSVNNSLPEELFPQSVTYDVYLRAKQGSTLLPTAYVGSGALTIGTLPLPQNLEIPAGAGGTIAGNDIFSGITSIPAGSPYPFINSQGTPHPIGVYTVIVHFTGVEGQGDRSETKYGETSIGFGINSEAALT